MTPITLGSERSIRVPLQLIRYFDENDVSLFPIRLRIGSNKSKKIVANTGI